MTEVRERENPLMGSLPDYGLYGHIIDTYTFITFRDFSLLLGHQIALFTIFHRYFIPVNSVLVQRGLNAKRDHLESAERF